MGKLIKLNSDQKRFIAELERKVEKDLDSYKDQYPPHYLSELEYLVNEGVHPSLANAIAEDLFFSNDMEDIKVFNRKAKKQKVALLDNPK